MRQRGDYGEQPERSARFTVKVRCRACWQVVAAVPERDGTRMWQHKLGDGTDCPAWRAGTDHEPVDARAKREQLERERAAFVPEPLAPNTFRSWPKSRDAEQDAAAEDDYSGDYRDRRAGGSRC